MRGKADDAGVLSHGKEENAVSRKKTARIGQFSSSVTI